MPHDIPVPDGAEADDWPMETEDGVPVRSVTWSRHDTMKVRVEVAGRQYADDGRIEKGITLYDRLNSIGEIDADDARQLATKLEQAADALDRLK
jgi:hypothetical protein